MDVRGKQLFVLNSHTKDSWDYPATAIFASKVATVISKRHFASARLLDNHLVASRKLEAYQQPLINNQNQDLLKEALEQKAEIEGAGLVDEVLNFIGETDKNIVNFGIQIIPNSNVRVISKIDYNRCTALPEEVKQYKAKRKIIQNDERKYVSLVIGHPELIQQERYLPEKCYARLKLALFPRQLFEALAKKAYIRDSSKVTAAVNEYCKRAELALNLLCRDPALIAQLKAKKIDLNTILDELKNYIQNHFDQNTAQTIINHLMIRKKVVVKKIVAALGPISQEEKIPNSIQKILQFIMDLDSRLKNLPQYRQNYFGNLVSYPAVNLQHRLQLERKLEFYQFQLRCHKKIDIDKIAVDLDEDIKAYKACLTGNQKENTSRYLKDLDEFLGLSPEKKHDLTEPLLPTHPPALA